MRRKLVRAVMDRPDLDDGFHGKVVFDVFDNEVKVQTIEKPVSVRLPA